MSKRLEQIRKRNDELIVAFRTFCLTPSQKLFTEICNYGVIQTRYAESFTAWKLACMFKYGYDDGEKKPHSSAGPFNSYAPNNAADSSESTMDYPDFDHITCSKAQEHPTRSLSLTILCMFYATGELKYIDLYYQCIGHEALTPQTRGQLMELFRDTKREFTSLVAKLGVDHIDALHLQLSTVDFSYFDNVKDRAIAERERRDATNRLIAPST